MILLAEPTLTALGLYGSDDWNVTERRVMRVREPSGFDVLVSDDPALANGLAGIAVDDGLSCVVTTTDVDADLHERFTRAGRTLLVGADMATGLATSLAAHELAKPDHIRSTTIAWTVPGRARRRGTAVPFPDPLGPRWGKRTGKRRNPNRRIVVPIKSDWAAATVLVEGTHAGADVTRVIGVADHGAHLAAIALAAGAIAAAEGAYAPGIRRPAEAADAYLAAALRVGLGVAAYTE